MPRFVRRKPLSERVMAAINPLDFFLWLSEEIQTREWDPVTVGTQVGLAMNFTFLLARANGGPSSNADDVFTDNSSSGWVTFIAQTWVLVLVCFSLVNTFFALFRTRAYRLFEANVEQLPGTPSAHRVRVQSSPVSSSPLRYVQDMLASETAESRAHPDKSRDVWEIAMWDPLPISQQVFALFNPGHVYVYMMTLPLEALDRRPSVAVFNCMMVQLIISSLLLLVQSRYAQLMKDTAIIQKEVLHEYDTKFVYPQLHPVVRDVGTQFSPAIEGRMHGLVEVGTPTTLLRRGFQIRPNPNYAKYVDPDGGRVDQISSVATPRMTTPATKARYSDSFTSARDPPPSVPRHSMPASNANPAFPPQNATQAVPTTNFGGSMGIFTHVNSPLKKAMSMGDMNAEITTPRNSREMAAIEQRDAMERLRRRASPLKEDRRLPGTPGRQLGQESSPAPAPNPFANLRSNYQKFERFPSRR